MSRTRITEDQASVLRDCKGCYCRASTADAEKHCLDLMSRGLMRRRLLPVIGGGRTHVYKATPEGVRVLNGEAAKPQSPRKKERRKWAAETNVDRKAGVCCCWPGCSESATEGHHAAKVRTRDNSRANRRPLCTPHHHEAESDPVLAKRYGISVSSLGTIAPAFDAAPSQRQSEERNGAN